MKQLIAFDLDGTLAESKSAIDDEMAGLLGRLLSVARVAVISGGDWPQFEKQLIANLEQTADLSRLSLLPTCGAKFFTHADGWKNSFTPKDLTADQKTQIVDAFKQAVATAGISIAKTYGPQIEDRGTQITFSALGQDAPGEAKKTWDPSFEKRKRIQSALNPLLPDFSVRLGGTTSVDITRPGIDKAYGIRKLRDTLGIALDDMLFVGDALFLGGNDYAAKEAGVVTIQVRDPDECKRVIEAIIACLGGVKGSTSNDALSDGGTARW